VEEERSGKYMMKEGGVGGSEREKVRRNKN
jgi:hypothetical protein